MRNQLLLAGVRRALSSGNLQGAVLALNRTASVAPALKPPALAANIIHKLEGEGDRKQAILLKLLASPAVTGPLDRLDRTRTEAVRHAANEPEETDLPPLRASLLQFADEVWSWKGAPLHAILEGVISAGGLGEICLAMEFREGLSSMEDYELARNELKRLEEGWRTFFGETPHGNTPSGLMIGREAERQIADLTGPQKRDLGIDLLLATYLSQQFPPGLFPEGGSPGLWTDLFLKRSRPGFSEGSCVPVNGLFAHLSLQIGREMMALLPYAHTAVYDPEVGLSIEVLPEPALLALEDWHAGGMLGKKESPAPSYAFFASAVMNLKPNTVERDLDEAAAKIRMALEVYPETSFGQVVLASIISGGEEADAHLDRAIRLGSENPIILARAASVLAIKKRFDEAASLFEEAVRWERERIDRHSDVQVPLHLVDAPQWGRVTARLMGENRAFPEAVRVVEGIVSLQPKACDAWVSLGQVLYEVWWEDPERPEPVMRRLAEAMEAAIATAPADFQGLATAHFMLGTACWHLERNEEDIFRHWEEGIRRDPAWIETLRRFVGDMREQGSPETTEFARRTRRRFEGYLKD